MIKQRQSMKSIRNLFTQPRISKTLVTMQQDPVVTVSEGKLRGAVKQLYDGTSYYSFKGIPYAQPPVGDLRFKAPLPVKPWQGIKDATEHGSVCPQFHIETAQVVKGNEDCLFVNIYTKSLQQDSKLPVMIFIHGGAYRSGSGNSLTLGPDYLLQHDVILVTLNYRLEVLGFLCLDTPEVPGNAGMKDQVTAMRWVKENISRFGGDPNNITLFGESSGACSVTYHMVSPMSKGLFHKAIAQSVVCTQDWSRAVGLTERSFRVGKVLGKDTKNPTELLEYLKTLSSDKLIKLSYLTCTAEEKHWLLIYFCPVVEKKFDGIEQFMTEEPIDLLLANKIHNVPLMLGFNSNEGLTNLKQTLRKLDFYNKNPQYLVPRDISLKVSAEKGKEIGEAIVQFYSKTGTFSKETETGIVDMVSDFYFVYNILRFAHFYSKYQKQLYLYRFDYNTELNFIKQLLGVTHHKGACHADDLFYIFSNLATKKLYSEKEELRNIIYKVTKHWTDFAKTGNPTPDTSLGVTWSPFTSVEKQFLHLGEQTSMHRDAYKERTEFMNKMFSDAGLPCITKST